MSRSYCECPRCRRQLSVRWNWKVLKTAYLHDEYGEVVTDSDCLDATRVRVVYPHYVECPHCGTHLRVEYELVPRFYASKEVANGTD